MNDINPRLQKFIDLAFSRKFLIFLLATLSALGIVEISDVHQEVLIKVIVLLGGASGAALAIAFEDIGRAFVSALEKFLAERESK